MRVCALVPNVVQSSVAAPHGAPCRGEGAVLDSSACCQQKRPLLSSHQFGEFPEMRESSYIGTTEVVCSELGGIAIDVIAVRRCLRNDGRLTPPPHNLLTIPSESTELPRSDVDSMSELSAATNCVAYVGSLDLVLHKMS
mmetsp:Transcript_43719/g.123536  ORF Transcript_43719/g.123536 Transcript_43719/m.123536 type:complete len:140 (-) Transcript_43719:1522-1941(-)